MEKMFLINGRSRTELAGALAEYRTYCHVHPGDDLSPVLRGVSTDIRAALKERRRVDRAFGLRYLVKCDECKTVIRRTDSMHESACGGRCDACKAVA